MPTAKRHITKRRTAERSAPCIVPGCGAESWARGMCASCYQFDRYHLTARHGLPYFLEHERRALRTVERCRMRGARRQLRLVRAGGAR